MGKGPCPSPWARLILKVYEADLPVCPKCNGPMRVSALIDDPAVVVDLDGLPEDLADRFIVATDLVHGAALMTADKKLLDWRHPMEGHDARM